MNNSEYTSQALGVLGSLYNRQISPAMIVMWCKALADLERQDLEAAIQAHIETNEWFPAPAHIRKLAADFAMKRQGVPTPLEAWESVRKGRTFDPPHPLATEAFRQLGGWSSFGQSPVDQEASWRARFIQAYEALLDRYRHDQLLLSESTREMARLPETNVNKAIKDLFSGMRLTDGQS